MIQIHKLFIILYVHGKEFNYYFLLSCIMYMFVVEVGIMYEHNIESRKLIFFKEATNFRKICLNIEYNYVS